MKSLFKSTGLLFQSNFYGTLGLVLGFPGPRANITLYIIVSVIVFLVADF